MKPTNQANPLNAGDHVLFPDFRIECWYEATDDDENHRYSIGLCADGVKRFPDGNFASSKSLVGGTVLLNEDGSDFRIEPDITRPSGMTHTEARIIVSQLFEELGRGAGVDDEGGTWKPVRIEAFFAAKFYSPQCHQLTRMLLRCVEESRRPVRSAAS